MAGPRSLRTDAPTLVTISLRLVLLRKLQCLKADVGDCLDLPPVAARLLTPPQTATFYNRLLAVAGDSVHQTDQLNFWRERDSARS